MSKRKGGKKGNPFFMEGLRERRKQLLKRLRAVEPSMWEQVMARFAFDHDLRIEKVREYFKLLNKAGLLTRNEEGEYEPIQ